MGIIPSVSLILLFWRIPVVDRIFFSSSFIKKFNCFSLDSFLELLLMIFIHFIKTCVWGSSITSRNFTILVIEPTPWLNVFIFRLICFRGETALLQFHYTFSLVLALWLRFLWENVCVFFLCKRFSDFRCSESFRLWRQTRFKCLVFCQFLNCSLIFVITLNFSVKILFVVEQGIEILNQLKLQIFTLFCRFEMIKYKNFIQKHSILCLCWYIWQSSIFWRMKKHSIWFNCNLKRLEITQEVE